MGRPVFLGQGGMVMKIAPIDIAHKTFARKMMGLDPDEVSEFLRDVAEEFEAVIRERNQLKETMREKELQILEYRDRDKALKETIMTAHKMTEGLKKDSEREAQLILHDAAQKADIIIKDARDSLKKAYSEISDLKRAKVQFEASLRGMIATFNEMLDRQAGYLPHMPSADATQPASPTMRSGKPIIES